MPIDASLVGREFPPTRPYAVSEEKVREFAAASGTAYAGGPAPATFPIVLAFDAMNAFLAAEELELFRIVHGEQRFAYQRPVVPGDVLSATLTVASQEFAAGGEESCEASFQKSVDSGQADIPDSIEIGEVTTEGDTATVPVTADGQDTDFTVVQEDGEWKIDLTGAAAAPSDTSGATDTTG